MRRALLAVIPLLLAGCAAGDPAGRSPAQTAGAQPRRYQTTATVLESREHGPELCMGIVLTSSPPQCGGVPITNWRWDQVEDHQAAAGTTWGYYHLVGTYDGASFTVVQVDRPPPRPDRATGSSSRTSPSPGVRSRQAAGRCRTRPGARRTTWSP
jgi:hypothetical protein